MSKISCLSHGSPSEGFKEASSLIKISLEGSSLSLHGELIRSGREWTGPPGEWLVLTPLRDLVPESWSGGREERFTNPGSV